MKKRTIECCMPAFSDKVVKWCGLPSGTKLLAVHTAGAERIVKSNWGFRRLPFNRETTKDLVAARTVSELLQTAGELIDSPLGKRKLTLRGPKGNLLNGNTALETLKKEGPSPNDDPRLVGLWKLFLKHVGAIEEAKVHAIYRGVCELWGDEEG